MYLLHLLNPESVTEQSIRVYGKVPQIGETLVFFNQWYFVTHVFHEIYESEGSYYTNGVLEVRAQRKL